MAISAFTPRRATPRRDHAPVRNPGNRRRGHRRASDRRTSATGSSSRAVVPCWKGRNADPVREPKLGLEFFVISLPTSSISRRRSRGSSGPSRSRSDASPGTRHDRPRRDAGRRRHHCSAVRTSGLRVRAGDHPRARLALVRQRRRRQRHLVRARTGDHRPARPEALAIRLAAHAPPFSARQRQDRVVGQSAWRTPTSTVRSSSCRSAGVHPFCTGRGVAGARRPPRRLHDRRGGCRPGDADLRPRSCGGPPVGTY